MIFLQTELFISLAQMVHLLSPPNWQLKAISAWPQCSYLFYIPKFILFLTSPQMQFWFQKVLFKTLRYLKCTLLLEIFRVTSAMITTFFIYHIYDRVIYWYPPWGLLPYRGEEVCGPQWPRQLWSQKHRLLIGPPMPDRSKSRGQMKCSPWSFRLGAGGWAWG
jgi:hypothetical protein